MSGLGGAHWEAAQRVASQTRGRFTGVYAGEWGQIAREVKDAAGWRCVRCDHAHDAAAGYCLTVHHLDGDKGNNAWWNLLALCQRCHLSIQSRVIPERPWMFDHSPWFVPYVCGFYASYYGGLTITRADAEADPSRWLALNPATTSHPPK